MLSGGFLPGGFWRNNCNELCNIIGTNIEVPAQVCRQPDRTSPNNYLRCCVFRLVSCDYIRHVLGSCIMVAVEFKKNDFVAGGKSAVP